jgi:hypothetical protein
VGAAVRAAVLMLTAVALVAWWVYFRDDLRRRWRNTMAMADASRSSGNTGSGVPQSERPA